MNLWLRLLLVVIGSMFRPRLGFLDESVLRMRVWPTDLDPNVHMNNARYLSVMDLGRFDLILRTGMGRVLRRKGWRPLMGAAWVRYRRALAPFERFEIRSRFVGWDERRSYVEHRILVNGELSCHAIMWAGFRRGAERVAPGELARELGLPETSPPLPAWVQHWRALDASVSESQAAPPARAAE